MPAELDAVAPNPRKQSLLRALPGIVLMVIGWSAAAGTPLPSEYGGPTSIVDPVVSCAELAALPESAEVGARIFAIGAGHIEPLSREGYVRLVCDDGGSVEPRANMPTITGNPGLFRVRAEVDGSLAIRESCLGCDEMSPRRVIDPGWTAVWVVRGIAGLLGLLGIALFVRGWSRRPYEPLVDLTGRRAPTVAHVLERPSAERIRLDGVEHTAPRLAVRGGRIAPAPEARRACIELAVSTDYRSATNAVTYVVGPARVGGLTVPAGRRAPLLDGDRVTLRGSSAVSVSFPEPGVVARFFAGPRPGTFRIVGRFLSPRGRSAVPAALLTTSAGLAISLADFALGFAIGSAVLAAGLALTLALPRQQARLQETRLSEAELAELEVAIEEGGAKVTSNGRVLAWLPRAEASPLATIVHLELRRLIAWARR